MNNFDYQQLNEIIHSRIRLAIMSLLILVDEADFNFLLNTLDLTKGNLSSHVDRLEKAGYVKIVKSFNGRIPHTDFSITESGTEALEKYWEELDAIRNMKDMRDE